MTLNTFPIRRHISAINLFLLILCRNFVSLNPPPAPLPSILKIMRIYSYMTHGITIKTLCARTAPRENNIDERYVTN